ncbi:MAG: hypothetical protein INQ03_22935 [Candidatus Heimdallarchaeota archaeon]|nr:hypothetical protein [Candidatus Heimdallarchaeota archaeon]
MKTLKLYLNNYFIIVFILILAVLIPGTSGDNDTTKPIYYSAEFSEDTINAGNSIDLLVNASDSQSGIAMIVYYIMNPSDLCTLEGELNYNNVSGLWEDTFVVSPFWDGQFYVELVIKDFFLNTYDSRNDGGYVYPVFNVIGASSVDNSPPSFPEITFSQSTISPGLILTCMINVTDNISGVKSVKIKLGSRQDIAAAMSGQVFLEEFMEFNNNLNTWQLVIINIPDYWPAYTWSGQGAQDPDKGYIEVYEVNTLDFAGNRFVYDSSYISLNIAYDTVIYSTETPDLTSPTSMEDCAFCEFYPFHRNGFLSVLKNNETHPVLVDVDDDAYNADGVSGVKKVVLEVTNGTYNVDGTVLAVIELEFLINPYNTQELWLGYLTLNEYWVGEYQTNVLLYDNVGNIHIYPGAQEPTPAFYAYDPTVDEDHDGLPDQWETYTDTVDGNIAPDEDNDGDGVPAIDEYRYDGSDFRDDTDDDGMPDYDKYMMIKSGWTKYKLGWEDSDLDGISDKADDADGDGLDNYDEVWKNTYMWDWDTDNDCLSDGFEDVYKEYESLTYLNGPEPGQWDDIAQDIDGDGLNFLHEQNYGTHPYLDDTDGDTLLDYDEIMIYQTNASNADSDYDTLDDPDEFVVGTDPWNNDTDGDGLVDGFEVTYSQSYTDINGTSQIGTISPFEYDTDGDVLSDFTEVMLVGSYPFLHDSDFDNVTDYDEYWVYGSSPMLADTDADDLSDNYEIYICHTNVSSIDSDLDGLNDSMECLVYFTDPWKIDTDGDGLNDTAEVLYQFSSPFIADEDEDGLNDLEEYLFGSNSTKADTDDDGQSDLYEHTYDLDPNLNDTYLDVDGDGIISIMEYYNGTHPGNADPDGDGLNDYYELLNGTNPWNNDTDADGISDGDEVLIYETDPHSTDTDLDKISDYEEIVNIGSDPTKYDTDQDWLSDYEEIYVYFTNWNSNDTDHDNVTDVREIRHYFTNPLNNDTDSDGLYDYDEIFIYRTDPTNEDTDNDGLKDSEELNIYNTDPLNPDVDNDGLMDGDEIEYNTDPFVFDTDNDTLSDGYEVNTLGSDPTKVDTDDDTMPDWWEAKYNLKITQNDTEEDADDDLLINLYEYKLGTDPTNQDTDGDGYSDYEESAAGSDPLEPKSHPNPDTLAQIMEEPAMAAAAILTLVAAVGVGVKSATGGSV